MFLGLFFINPTKRWVSYSTDKKEIPNLKIVTFNVKGGKFGENNIERFIDTQNADVVFLQEDAEAEYHFKNLKRQYKIPVVSLYSKHKIIGHKDLIVGEYEGFNAYSDQTDIEIQGKTYRFINTYLQPFKFEKSMVKLNGNSGEDEKKIKDIIRKLIPTFKMHQEQVHMIRKSIDRSPFPVILAGDLNSVPNSYEYYHLSEGLKDAFFEAGKGSGTSFHDYKFPLRIDYIFTSKSIKPIHYKIDYSVELSDHYPVIAEFLLN
jgi:exonuclease III